MLILAWSTCFLSKLNYKRHQNTNQCLFWMEDEGKVREFCSVKSVNPSNPFMLYVFKSTISQRFSVGEPDDDI